MNTPAVLSASIATRLLKSVQTNRSLPVFLAAGLGIVFAATPMRGATVTWDGEAGANWSSAFNWTTNMAPGIGDSLVFAGAFNTTTNNDLPANTLFGGLTFSTTSAAFNLTGNAIRLGGDIVDNSLNAQTIGLSEALTATRAVNVSSIDGSLTISGPVSGAGFGLTKTGSGLLTVSGSNTFTGRVTVSGGTLAIASDGTSASNPLGSGANGAGLLVLDGGALRTTLATQLSTNRGVRLGNAGGGGGTIDTASSGTTIYNGVMANNGGTNSLTKTGVGILALGGVNTYTGRTFINLGTLKLDFSALSGTTSNIINSASTLVLGGVSTALGNANATGPVSTTAGATLSMVSKSNANSTQTFNGVTFNGGYSTIQTVQTGTGRNLLTLGIITRSYATSALTGYNAAYGGLVNFSFAGTLSANNAIKTGTGNTNNILGGWATYQAGAGAPIADYAANDGAGNIIAYTGYTTQPGGTLASNALLNYQSSHSSAAWNTGAGTTDFNTLSIRSDTTGASTLTPAPGSTLRLGATGGFLIGSTAATLAIGNGSSSATLTAGGALGVPGEISFISSNTTVNTTSFDISMKIADNGASGIVSVTFGGTQGSGNSTQGALAQLSGPNTYSGGTTITTGRVIGAGPGTFGTGSVTVYSGAQAYLSLGGTYANNWNIAGSGTSITAGNPGSYDTPSALRIGANNTTLTGAGRSHGYRAGRAAACAGRRRCAGSCRKSIPRSRPR